ncbi:MAG: transcription antitermination factor NusB [Eubacteriales bacterium]|nr:transcription antitermination factor NusB [Eubacteriales bacterium]
MKRDIAREIAVQIVFGTPFSGGSAGDFLEEFFSGEHFASMPDELDIFSALPDDMSMEYIRRTVNGVFDHLEEIDSLIGGASKGWSVRRISGTARSVLRVAVYEMLYADDVPVGAAINSAVEIDKKYDDADVVSFVNGVLGSIAKGISDK